MYLSTLGWHKYLQAPSHFLNQCWLVYWCIYAARGLTELKIVLCVNVAFGCEYSDQSLFEITWRGIWFLIGEKSVRWWSVGLEIIYAWHFPGASIKLLSLQWWLFFDSFLCRKEQFHKVFFLLKGHFASICSFPLNSPLYQDNQSIRQSKPAYCYRMIVMKQTKKRTMVNMAQVNAMYMLILLNNNYKR